MLVSVNLRGGACVARREQAAYYSSELDMPMPAFDYIAVTEAGGAEVGVLVDAACAGEALALADALRAAALKYGAKEAKETPRVATEEGVR